MRFGIQWCIVIFFSVIIISCRNHNSEQPLPENITFSDHIAPLIHTNCTPCHRPGSPGPFSLITYNDVLRKAKTIVKVTQSRFMPPWPADPTYSNFVGDRSLEQKEIEMISRWVQMGCPIGDSTKIPSPPHYPEGSQIGKADMMIKFPEAIQLKANNQDNFFLMKIPYRMDEDRYVKAIEFMPGNKKLLHHMNANLIVYEPGKKKDVFDGEKIIYTNIAQNAEDVQTRMDNKNDDGTYPVLIPLVCNYLPGVSPPIYPEGIGGFRMAKQGAFFINDIHYGPAPADTIDNGSYFNIFFADKPPTRPTYEILLGSLGVAPVKPQLVIPANEIKMFTIDYMVQQDMSVLTINPHMHLIGESFLAYALTPAKDTIPLIKIPKWDFRWQYFYTFKKVLKIPAGSVIHVEGVFDNTSSNPNNPFNPPQVIIDRGNKFDSMKTTNEMLQLIITYMSYKPGDENISLENQRLTN
jgi:hypothetical protein